METTKLIPTTGQFVAVWEFNGVVWSCALRWFGTELMCFSLGSTDGEDSCWIEQCIDTYIELNATYILNNKE